MTQCSNNILYSDILPLRNPFEPLLTNCVNNIALRYRNTCSSLFRKNILESTTYFKQKSWHRVSDPTNPAAAAMVSVLVYFLKALYIVEGGRPGCFILCIKMPHVTKFPSVTCPMTLTSFSWFSDYLKKKLRFFVIMVMLHSLL